MIGSLSSVKASFSDTYFLLQNCFCWNTFAAMPVMLFVLGEISIDNEAVLQKDWRHRGHVWRHQWKVTSQCAPLGGRNQRRDRRRHSSLPHRFPVSSFFPLLSWCYLRSQFVLGSKVDLRGQDAEGASSGDGVVIDGHEGESLANQCGAFFSEVSSRNGHGISESVQLIAQELAKLEDKELENAKNVVLKNSRKKKGGCCGWHRNPKWILSFYISQKVNISPYHIHVSTIKINLMHRKNPN